MGKKSRQKKIRRALRPLIEQRVSMEMRRARDNPMNWKILPDELPAVSAKPEQEKSRLVVPSAAAVAAIEASRQ